MADRTSGREAHSVGEIVGGLADAMMSPMPEPQPSVVPDDWRELDLGMSNFGHEVEEGLEDALKAGSVYARHAGWNFNGLVWFDAETGQFKEEVWQYHVPQRVYTAESLEALMEVVNDDWGWD